MIKTVRKAEEAHCKVESLSRGREAFPGFAERIAGDV
jgi:hypothetical protein